eukprot:GHVT01031885.1.p1 GENE.GHVT01031885.1~~GHVT01031885.1.p1  ORF type:complete len:121 (-),score=14.51 GHVT01031885.1:249-611(-)
MRQEVSARDIDKLREVPSEGVNVHGFYIQGARWNWLDGRLEDSAPKVLVDRMPVIFLTAAPSKETKANRASDAAGQMYSCPVYKYPKRTDKNLIFRLNLKTDEHPSHWRLRGTAILCFTE